MGGRIALAAALTATLAATLVAAPTAHASLDTLLSSSSCSLKDAADGDTTNGVQLPFYRCDDGLPPAGIGGTTPNPLGTNAVKVPSAYQGYKGLPAKDPGPVIPGEDATDDIALDVDVTLPDPGHFGGAKPADDRYPLIVFMHGCCSGQRTDWEGDTVDEPDGKEKWHHSSAWFAARGYVVLTYTARGFVKGNGTAGITADDQGSTGQTQLDDRRFEINDYQQLVGLLVDRGDLDPDPARVVKVAPDRIVTVGGSYGGGFSWLALTDPTWKSPGGTEISLAASAPKFGWTDLAYSLVPNGSQLEGRLPAVDGSDTSNPLGFPKRSIVAGLYLSGKTGLPSSFNHTTFSSEIDDAFVCLQSPLPVAANPACAGVVSTTLPGFVENRSAYYQNDFFDGLRDGSVKPVPLFSAGTTTDPLFPGREHRRMVERLKSAVPDYPVEQYFGDYNHFVQDKRKEWSDLCGSDHHVCTYSDYPGGDLNVDPPSLARRGINTMLSRFVDRYARPPGNPSQGAPPFDVTASLQVCPQNASARFPADEPGERFTASSFDALAPNTLTVRGTGEQRTTSTTTDQHRTQADPVANQLANATRCPVHTSPAGAGVATYDSPMLERDYTMIGSTRVSVPYSASGGGELQLNARLYDLLPDGRTEVMVDRGFRALASPDSTAVIDLLGNGWRFPKGHRVRVELAQDDDPYVKASTTPSSLTLSGATLEIPVREASAAIGGSTGGGSTGGGSGGGGNGGGSGGDGAGSRSRGGSRSGSGSGTGGETATGPAGGGLPFTGLAVGGLVAAGMLMLAAGRILRRRAGGGV